MSKVVDVVVDSTKVVDNQKLAEIGSRMKVARESSGLSRPLFVAKFGGSVRTLENNEGGRNEPGAVMVSSFVSLGINANWLLTGVGPMLLADLVTPAAPQATRINTDALEAIIEGTIKALPKASPDAIARQAVGFYVQCIEKELITPEGIGSSNLNAAA